MNVLVIGAGGREHAIVRAIKNSTSVRKTYCFPGNGGILDDAEPLPAKTNDVPAVVAAATDVGIELVIVGPEAELVAGFSDAFRAAKILVFGPSQEAAQLEGSKIFAKKFMQEFGVPTARAVVVKTREETLAHAKDFTAPFILKADGLAAGKGVFICRDISELENAAKFLFDLKGLGPAGAQALLEENLPGEEISVLAVTNGKDFSLLPICRDHKRLLDGDRGPNTGGMGVVGPVPLPADLLTTIRSEIFDRTMAGLQARGFLYRGVIFIGIMLTAKGPKVLEYNVRFGDPETQVIMPLLNGDWAETFKRVASGEAPNLNWNNNRHVACIVLAAEGYPDNPKRGVEISGLANKQTEHQDGYVLHAGTKKIDGKFVTAGGRVLNAVGVADSLAKALQQAYLIGQSVQWPGMQYRKDIGKSLI